MKAIKFNFSIETCYVNSKSCEIIELQFDDDATEEEIEKEVEEIYTEWLFEHNYGGFSKVS